MSVVEKRVRGILHQAKPLAAKMPRETLAKLLSDTFGDQFVEPDPPAKFAYHAGNGMVLNIRPEPRGKRIYWFCNKQHLGVKYHLYIAPAGRLSIELLENAASHIEANSVTVSAPRP